MESSRRLRTLFFFAAFLLCLSVCFVYAQDTPGASSRPALWMTPTHSAFLAPDAQPRQLAAPSVQEHATPMASQAVLSQVEAISHAHHRFHLGHQHSRRASLNSATQNSSNQDSAILELLLQNHASAQ